MNYNQVAKTILEQLGGGKFRAMTGAKHFLSIPEGCGALSFQLPSRKINYVKITLNGGDLYDLEFSRIAGPKKMFAKKVVSEHRDVFADQLQDIFTEATGLDTHL